MLVLSSVGRLRYGPFLTTVMSRSHGVLNTDNNPQVTPPPSPRVTGVVVLSFCNSLPNPNHSL